MNSNSARSACKIGMILLFQRASNNKYKNIFIVCELRK